MTKTPHINNGYGTFREVSDRKLSTKPDPERIRSQEEGRKGKGLNKQTMNESLADFNHGVEITEE